MTRYAPNIADSIHAAVTNVAATVALSMQRGRWYLFASDTACWIAQGDEPTAAADDGSMYLPAGHQLFLFGTHGADLSVIRHADNGDCSLTPVELL